MSIWKDMHEADRGAVQNQRLLFEDTRRRLAESFTQRRAEALLYYLLTKIGVDTAENEPEIVI